MDDILKAVEMLAERHAEQLGHMRMEWVRQGGSHWRDADLQQLLGAHSDVVDAMSRLANDMDRVRALAMLAAQKRKG